MYPILQAFIGAAVYFLTRPSVEIQLQEKLVFSAFFVGAIACLGKLQWQIGKWNYGAPIILIIFYTLQDYHSLFTLFIVIRNSLGNCSASKWYKGKLNYYAADISLS